MSLEVELGGVVGRFLDVSAIRGIPLGPFMNRHVAPLLGRED
jgi:translocation and assembly module TamB